MFVKFLEKFGIFLFIISLLINSQLRWAQKFNYNDIDLRITMCFALSIIVYLVIMKMLVSKQINTDNISFALSFSVIAIYLNSNQEIIILLVIVLIIYFIKKYNSNSLFEEFWGHTDYKFKFDSGQSNVQIINNSKKKINIFKFKYLITELINCIIYCKGNKMSNLIIESEETKKINDIIIKVFNNFDIEVDIVEEIKIPQ